MPDVQRTLEDQARLSKRGQQLLDLRDASPEDSLQKLLLLILDSHIGPGATWDLRFATLAAETLMHDTTVRRKASELADQGLIHFEETAPGSSVYTFRIIRSNLAELAEAHRQNRGPLPRMRGRPKKSQSDENRCTPQINFAGCKNEVHTAKENCTPQLAPYIERPLNDIQTNPITHARGATISPASDEPPPRMNGDGVKKNGFGGWDSPIEDWQLTNADCVQARYLEAVRKGWITGSDQTRINFFALSRYCGKSPGIKSRPAAFTFYLKREKWEVFRCEDLDAAEKAVRKLGGPTPEEAKHLLGIGFGESPMEHKPQSPEETKRTFHDWAKAHGET